MHILVVGLNQKAAPIEIRERLAFPDAGLGEAFSLLGDYAQEGVILSTCNRTEVYGVTGHGSYGSRYLAQFLSQFHRLALEDFEPYLYTYGQSDAVRHLFAVSAGIDSMIVGEPQILGQVRDAYEAALANDGAGRVLSQLFRHAISVGKLVRTETDISRNAVSVSYAAVELGRKIFGELRSRGVLVIGAGEMGELTAKTLVDIGVGSVMVANRTRERAQELADRVGGNVVDFGDLARMLSLADIVISSTGAPGFVITAQMVAQAMHVRRQRPLFLIDIAVPRDIDPAVQRLNNVFLYNVDDLAAVCEANMRERQKEIKRVDGIIDAEVKKFIAWWDALDVVPTITALRDKAESIRQAELDKAYRKLNNLSDNERDTINALTRAIVNKMLHQPTVRLKGRSDGTASRDYSRAVRELFDLDARQEDQ